VEPRGDDDDRVPASLAREPRDELGLAAGRVGIRPRAEHVHTFATEPDGARRARVEAVRDHEHRRDAAIHELEPDRKPVLASGEHDDGIGLRNPVVVVEDEEQGARDDERKERRERESEKGPPHMTAKTTVSTTAVRRLAIAAQGYGSRYRRARTAEVEAAIRALSCVQLDSISTVERSDRIALSSRIGDYPRDAASRLLKSGRVFEYWAHEACLIPVEDWPLFRPAMRAGGRQWYGQVERTHPHLAEEILGEIRERGPLPSRHFEGSSEGGMWNWKPAKAMLERLWNHGRLAVAGRQGFQRLYDLTERVLPAEVLAAPEPKEPERLRLLAARAVLARGVLTAAGVVEHWRLQGGTKRLTPALAALVDEGELEELAVEDGGAPVFVPRGADLEPVAPSAAVLLSPFDNLLWDRPFARRILGFDHLIEVYKPAPQRRYGYYVLPFLRGDRIVGRADLKSERAEGRLVVKAFHRENGVRASGALDDALDRALERLARSIGLEEVRR